MVGEKSQFGQHDYENDTFQAVLIDVQLQKKGFVPPRKFIRDFGDAGIPRIVYEGNLNKQLVLDVKNNMYGLKEGIIAKGVIPNRKENNLYYCKIKTNEWFDRLRNTRPDLYEEEMKQASKSPIII